MTHVDDRVAQMAQRVIAQASATSSAAMPHPSHGSVLSPDDDHSSTPSSQRKEPPPSPPGVGNGGGGGSNSRGSHSMQKHKTYLFWIIVMIIFFLASMFTQDWIHHRSVGYEREKLLIEFERAKVQQQIHNLQNSATSSVKQAASQPVTYKSFSCSTVEQMKHGFATEPTQVVSDSSKDHRFTSGCALVRIDFFVKNLRGHGYVFQEETANGGTFGCGDVNGVNFTPRQCADFLNSRMGQVMQLVVKNSGSVILN